MAKFRRRANGTGSVVKLSGKRRKPYMAKFLEYYDPITGKPHYKPIGYYAKRKEAEDALSLYRLSQKHLISDEQFKEQDLYTFEHVNSNVGTFQELYHSYFDDYLKNKSNASVKQTKQAYDLLKPFYYLKINTIKFIDYQNHIDSLKASTTSQTLSRIKFIIKNVQGEAIRKGYITSSDNLIDYLDIKSKRKVKKTVHKAFTLEEIEVLKKDNTRLSNILLLYILTGCRAMELVGLTKDNFKLDDEHPHIVTGSKTSAGKNRIIPVHEYILSFLKKEIEQSEVFLEYKQKEKYQSLSIDMKKHLNNLGLEHLMHDTRHTFATLCELYNVDVYAAKRILGHKFNDLTKDLYTHAQLEKLSKEINKIKI